MENNSEKTIKCSNCNADVPEGNKFCGICGKPIIIAKEESSPENNICPQCNSEVESDLKFCTKCGTEVSASQHPTHCPQCNSEVESDLKFCTKCGTELYPSNDKNDGISNITNSTWINKSKDSISKFSKGLVKDENVNKSKDSVSKFGKGLMKDVNVLLNSTADTIDNSLKKKEDPSQTKTKIKNVKKPTTNPGYLICDKCEGYYELQPGESPNDFADECECGGILKHKKKHVNK
ncbi:MAG: zinc ribbon domain-containing protein [Methanobacteriaceae archaeon]|nr:zinc ribbon domain-containing protein [Methanobacteriaceae archaeon]MDP2837404.1 zinc ribbon domain-containing protein [Methanobacteriaceae archaeon]MDP3624312.1 zinc ribbon domain-containing protein [Methanobacteriaceae archaeon]